ncbi:MAG: UvrD-helicase domain-containing protein [Patescibacteria group bacterium]
MEKILDGLNSAQAEAVCHRNGPLLLVAGAGTGKTTVITRRLAKLIQDGVATPDQVLALTFTDKAAGEMEERIDTLMPYGYTDLWVSTFHSFGERLLHEYGLDIGLPHQFKLLNQTDQWLLLREHIEELGLEYYRPKGNPTKFVEALSHHFSRLKDEMITPEQYVEYAEKLCLNLDAEVARTKQTLTDEERAGADEAIRIRELAHAYHVYQQLLLAENALDFGDLIFHTVQLLKKRPAILKKLRDQFRYIMVDEFQDTNLAQYELIKLIASPKNNLVAVGDDDQCLPVGTKVTIPGGEKSIESIKSGDVVLTAVGKGSLSTSVVLACSKKKKTSRFLTFQLEDGHSLTATDNHKLFCYVPRIDQGGRTYVYVMHSSLFGWRIGITNDLATRLSLERGADKIIALRSFSDPDEAKFYEILWVLRYQIPPVCFKEREGVAIKGEWLSRLYHEIDTEKNIQKLAKDLRVDLHSHHVGLDSVNRGRGKRLKIHFKLCYRSHKIKGRNDSILSQPLVQHIVEFQTSQLDIIRKLKLAGIETQKAKKGIRIRKAGVDLTVLENFAQKVAEITTGYIEYSFDVGRVNIQSKKALCMPAGNVVIGHFLPVQVKNHIEYKKVIAIQEKVTTENVYDLEIARSHNFLANGVVVHNSIFKWRGASVSNILHFQKDFPNLKQIVLTENYRSGQPILDLAYQFIQQNNPDRLESKLEIQKRLVAKSGREGKVFHLRSMTGEGEAHTIVRKIAELKQEHPDWTWSDFAVLVRANDHAESILPLLERANIPYQYVASTGLFLKPLMLDILSYLRVVENVHNNLALYRVLTMPMWKLAAEDVMAVLNYTARKPVGMLDTLKNCRAIGGLSVPACVTIERMLSLMAQHSQLVREKHAGEAVLKIVQDVGLMKWMTDQEEQKAAQHLVLLNQLFQLIASFEQSAEDKRVKYFLHNVDLMLEAGDAGALKVDIDEGPESVKVMTVHASKGLEFQAVFVTNLVDKRFPSVGRNEPISVPDDLLQEILPTGDAHLQEERRLFYVACTRAKQYLFLTSAEDYGGMRKKKPSRFLVECGLAEVKAEPTGVVAFAAQDQAIPAERAVVLSHAPETFSFSQFEAYERCPWQYRYRFVLKVPAPGNYSASFGRSVHDTLLEFFKRVRSNTEASQGTLFGPAEKLTLPTDKDLLQIFEDKWQSDWYATPKAEQEYKEAGRNALKEFYNIHHQAWPKVKYLEKGFSLRLKDVTVKGKIDRVDGVGDSKVQVNVVDYKTGRFKEKKDFNQLFIYAMAIQDVFKEEPQQVGYYFIEENKPLDKPVTQQALDKTRDWVLNLAEQILSGDFTPSPGQQCQFCDYRSICEFRAV